MKNNCTGTRRANFSMKLKATSSWIEVSLALCSTKPMTWPGSLRSNIATGNSSQRSCQKRLWQLSKTCLGLIKESTSSAASTKIMTSKTSLYNAWSPFSTQTTLCSSYRQPNSRPSATCRNYWPKCFRNYLPWHHSISSSITYSLTRIPGQDSRRNQEVIITRRTTMATDTTITIIITEVEVAEGRTQNQSKRWWWTRAVEWTAQCSYQISTKWACPRNC